MGGFNRQPRCSLTSGGVCSAHSGGFGDKASIPKARDNQADEVTHSGCSRKRNGFGGAGGGLRGTTFSITTQKRGGGAEYSPFNDSLHDRHAGITNKIVFKGMNHLSLAEVRLTDSPSKHRHHNGAPRSTCSPQGQRSLVATEGA